MTQVADPQWETVSAFPPPYPMWVRQWRVEVTHDEHEGTESRYPKGGGHSDVFLMLSQRRVGSCETRIVPGVIDAYGAVTAVDVGRTATRLTLVGKAGVKNLEDEPLKILEEWEAEVQRSKPAEDAIEKF